MLVTLLCRKLVTDMMFLFKRKLFLVEVFVKNIEIGHLHLKLVANTNCLPHRSPTSIELVCTVHNVPHSEIFWVTWYILMPFHSGTSTTNLLSKSYCTYWTYCICWIVFIRDNLPWISQSFSSPNSFSLAVFDVIWAISVIKFRFCN